MSSLRDTCAICCEQLDEKSATTRCGHVFHTSCLCASVAQHSSKCPLCRRALFHQEPATRVRSSLRIDIDQEDVPRDRRRVVQVDDEEIAAILRRVALASRPLIRPVSFWRNRNRFDSIYTVDISGYSEPLPLLTTTARRYQSAAESLHRELSNPYFR